MGRVIHGVPVYFSGYTGTRCSYYGGMAWLSSEWLITL